MGFFGKFGEFVSKHYWLVFGIVVAVTVFLGIMSEKIRIDTTWLSMLPESEPSVIEYKKIVKHFDSASPIIIAIEGTNLNLMKKSAKELAEKFKSMPDIVRDVNYRFNVEFLRRHGFMLQKESVLKRFKKIASDFNLDGFFKNFNDFFESEYIEESDEPLAKQEKDAVRFLDTLNDVLVSFRDYLKGEKGDEVLRWAAEQFSVGDGYIVSRDKTLLIMFAYPKVPLMEAFKAIDSVFKVEKVLDEFRTKYPELDFGQTGVYAIQKDEMEAGTHDTIFNFITAFILVLLLFMVSFRMVSSPFLAMTSLMLGIIWAVGLTYIFYGRLNISTAMIGPVLIGLGVDYSIHFLSGYTQARYRGLGVGESIVDSFARVGRGILTGALTTAVAFMSFVLVKISIIRELGIVIGSGILLTFIATITTLPIFLIFIEKMKSRFKKREKRLSGSMEFEFLGRVGEFVMRKHIWVILAVVVVTAGAVLLIPKLYFTGDLKKIEAEGLKSLELMDKIQEKFDLSPDSASFIVYSLEELNDKTEKLNKKTSVGFVESVATYMPPVEKQKRRIPLIREIKRSILSSRPIGKFRSGDFVSELRRLEANIIELSDMAYMGGLDRIVKRCDEMAGLVNGEKKLRNIFDDLEELVKKSDSRKLDRMQKIFSSELKKRFLEMCDTSIITLDKLPDDVKRLSVSRDGKMFLVNVYASRIVWDKILDSDFIKDVKEIAPNSTGMPIMFYLVTKLSAEGGKQATLWAFITILLILIVDFRSLGYSVMAMLPLIVGSLWTLAFLVITDFQFTYMTAMVVPLIMGIGIDDGVHIIHRYRIEGRGSVPVVLRTTGKAIVLTSLTTMIAFGSFAFSRMVGYRQFGITIFAGIGFMLLLSVVFLPALMKLTVDGKK